MIIKVNSNCAQRRKHELKQLQIQQAIERRTEEAIRDMCTKDSIKAHAQFLKDAGSPYFN